METSDMSLTNIGMMRPGCFTGYPFQSKYFEFYYYFSWFPDNIVYVVFKYGNCDLYL